MEELTLANEKLKNKGKGIQIEDLSEQDQLSEEIEIQEE